MKSPAARTPQKAYKHVKFMPLSHVRRVVDIRDNDGKCTLLVRPSFNLDHCRSRFRVFSLLLGRIMKDNFDFHQILLIQCCTRACASFVSSVKPFLPTLILVLNYLFCSTEFQNLFGIIYRCSQELKEKLLMFRLVGDEINKQEWLQKLTTGLANTACMADTVRTTHRDHLNQVNRVRKCLERP